MKGGVRLLPRPSSKKTMKNLTKKKEELAKAMDEEDLFLALERTRQEPGLEIKKVAQIIKDTFGEDTEFLIKELQK